MAPKVKSTAESVRADTVPEKKRRKVAPKTKKAKPGPFPLMDVPRDLLFEVFKHLRPMDLLNLARTNKALRTLLLRRSSRHVWRATYKNTLLRMPPCPDDMNEIAWVNLLYSHHCHECLKKGPHVIYWEIRARYCASCRNDMEAMFEAGYDVHSLQDHFSYEFEPGIGEISIFEVMPVMMKGFSDRVSLLYGIAPFRMSDWQELKRALKRASAKERSRLVLKRQKRLAKIREEIQYRLADWELRERHTRSYEAVQTLIAREKAIVQKLREHGYGDDYDNMTWDERNDFALLREVRQSRPLTDRIWKSIQGAIFDFMEDVRAARQVREEESDYEEEDEDEGEHKGGYIEAAEKYGSEIEFETDEDVDEDTTQTAAEYNY